MESIDRQHAEAMRAGPGAAALDPPLPAWQREWSEAAWDDAQQARLDAVQFEMFDESPTGAIENLALDTALLYDVADGRRPAVFRMWQWSERAVILGSYQSVSEEIDAEVATTHGFTFARRMSGGGAMVVEPQRTLTWSVIVPEQVVEGLSFVQSFAFLDAWCVRALRAHGVPATYRPINDIATADGKLAGAAQCRRRRTVLHHTTMAWQIDNAVMFDLLRLNQHRHNTRAVASAVKRVAPLAQYVSLDHAAMRRYLVEAFRTQHHTTDGVRTADDRVRADELVRTKFAAHDWLYRVP
jgi:lipoate---protein ligase